MGVGACGCGCTFVWVCDMQEFVTVWLYVCVCNFE